MNRVALVTGGAVRVGRVIVEELAAAGWTVAFTYNASADEAREVQEVLERSGCGCRAIRADVSEEHDRSRVADEVREHCGGLDALVNNAGVFTRTPFAEMTVEAYRRVLAINLEGPIFLAQACAPMLRERRGSIVNLTDIYADLPLRGKLAYSVSKAALAGATRALALELAPEIRVNAVAPFIAMFPAEDDERTRAQLIDRTLLKRASGPHDIARAVRFLIDGVETMTGQVLTVDSGRTLRL